MYRRNIARFLLCLLILCIGCRLSQAVSPVDAVLQDINGSHPSAVLSDDDTLIAQNERVSMFLDAENGIFKLEDRQNGYIWSSGRNDETALKMSRKWRAFAQSLASIDVINTAINLTSSENDDSNQRTFDILEDGFDAHLCFPISSIHLTIQIRLTADGFSATIPQAQIIQEDRQFRLNHIYLLPFLGASYLGEGEGYFLIPDGSGALMRFNQRNSTSSSLSLRIYGDDESLKGIGVSLNILNAVPTPARKQVSLPLFGIVHGALQNAMLCEITNGKEYCNLIVNPAGNIVDFNYACAQFIYAEVYNQPDATGTGFALIQQRDNDFDACVCVHLLANEDADYSGMARLYRQLIATEYNASEIQGRVMIEGLMAESVDALLGDHMCIMTTANDLISWTDALKDKGITGVLLSLTGSGNGGVSREKAGTMQIDSAIGDTKALDSLNTKTKQYGDLLGRTVEMSAFYASQLSGWHRAYGIDRGYISQDVFHYMDDKQYFMNLNYAEEVANKMIRSNSVFPTLCLGGIGQYLFSSYQSGGAYSRVQAIEKIQNILEKLSSSYQLALAAPNGYATPYASFIYDIPISNSMYLCETESVPFLQMVYGGSIQMFATTSIPGGEVQTYLLRLIDYNVYPHYILSEENSSLLSASNMNLLFATCFDDLLDELAREYHIVSDILSQVATAKPLQRTVIEDGIAVTEYDNSRKVVVNYLSHEVNVDGVMIPAGSAVVMEVLR